MTKWINMKESRPMHGEKCVARTDCEDCSLMDGIYSENRGFDILLGFNNCPTHAPFTIDKNKLERMNDEIEEFKTRITSWMPGH